MQVFSGPDMTGWGPEALGAGIGVAGAVLVASVFTAIQLRAEGRRASRHKMRDAFADLLASLQELEELIGIGSVGRTSAFEKQRLVAVTAATKWRLYAETRVEQLFAERTGMVLTRLLSRTEEAHRKGGEDAQDEFSIPGTIGRTLRDGIFEHGANWHSSRSRRTRRAARKWMDQESRMFRRGHGIK